MTLIPEQQPAQPGGLVASWRRWTWLERLGALGGLAGVASFVVGILAWQLPRQPAGDPPPPAATTTGGPGRPTGAATAPPPPSQGGSSDVPVYLAGGLTPEAGADRLVVELARAVPDTSRYGAHPVAIRCPANDSRDPSSDVTYLIAGHYGRFEATVRPYYPPGSDVRSTTYVTALTGIREKDASLTTTTAGEQKRATPDGPRPLTATVTGAEKLILRVRCGDPNGVVILTDARLTPA